eukprot:GEMP01084728.1.p1 GENE.GEMP01084728.1~~GEMP01084728.1.p1  ORF type:complete len:255 (+),score=41.97 GEMP01084728.1:185-949(+)
MRHFASCVPRRRVQLVGLKQGVFYGPDGSETALSVLRHTDGPLYVGLPEYEVSGMHPPETNRRIQPIKEIEKMDHREFIPPVQASVLEKRKVRALDRQVSVTVARVAMEGLKAPLESIKIWKHVGFKSYHKLKKDDAFRAHFQLHFPRMSHVYFNERAELISVSLLLDVGEEDTVVVVPLSLYPLVEEYIRRHRDSTTAELSKIKENLMHNPGHTESIVALLYVGIPLLILNQFVSKGFGFFDSAIFGEPECRD